MTRAPKSTALDQALTVFAPDADMLLRLISEHIDDSMLREIAEADYGHDADANLAALRDIRAGKSMAVPLPWIPKEVLELIRWSQPENPDWGPGSQGTRGHWMRAFSCAALLRASGEPDNITNLFGQNQTLIQLIWSLETLDAGMAREAANFLMWLAGRRVSVAAARGTFDDDIPFLALGILWFGLRSNPPIPDAAVIALSEWISETESRGQTAERAAYGLTPGRWLLDTTNYNICHGEWQRLGTSLLALDLTSRDHDAAAWPRLFGEMLTAEG